MRMITLGFFSHSQYITASTSVRAPTRGRAEGGESHVQGRWWQKIEEDVTLKPQGIGYVALVPTTFIF